MKRVHNINSGNFLGRLSKETLAAIADLNWQRESLARTYGVDSMADQTINPKHGEPISDLQDPLEAASVRFDTVVAYARPVAEKRGESLPLLPVEIYELHRRINLDIERATLIRMFGVEEAPETISSEKDSLQEANDKKRIVRQEVLEKAAQVLGPPRRDLAQQGFALDIEVEHQILHYKKQLRESINQLQSEGVYIPHFDPVTQKKLPFYSLRSLELARLQATGHGLTEDQFFHDQSFLFEDRFPADPPISMYEVFSPKEELDEIKALRRTNPQEAQKMISQWQEKLAFQRKGLQYLKQRLIEEVIFNPNVSLDQLSNDVVFFGMRFGFSESVQQDITEKARNYCSIHKLVSEARTQYPEKSELCEYLTGYRPKGEITLTFEPASIEMGCASDDDYAAIFGSGTALSSGGVYLGLRKGIPVTAIRGIFNKPDIHERQHVINSIIFPNTVSYPGVASLESIKTAMGNQDIPLVDLYLKEIILHYYLVWAKNEMVAFFKEGREKAKIISYLTNKENGSYDYGYKGRTALEKDPDITPEFKKRVNDVLVRSYDRAIVRAMGVLEVLTLEGYNKEEAIELLSDVPIEQWPNAVWRLLRPAARAA